MERVDTLLKKLQEQFAQNASASQLLLTVQMLEAELQQLSSAGGGAYAGGVAVTAAQNNFVSNAAQKTEPQKEEQATVEEAPVEEERTVEMLQVDEAEIEAELAELRKNAEMMNKISAHNKPHIVHEPDDDVPTLPQQPPAVEQNKLKSEVHEAHANHGTSINEKLKQSKIDLGDAYTEVPIRDLKKAIGVNDRYLFINELFRGDESMYERSIKTINSFSILPEAEYWIQRELKVKNGWNDSDELVKQFYQLVKRRFS